MANSKKLELIEETIAIPDLPLPFDGFRLLHLTDLHLPRHSSRIAELLTIAADTQPDLICLGGDYAYTALSLTEVEQFFIQLASRWPVVAIYGNADYRPDIDTTARARWGKCLPFLTNAAMCLQRDESELWIAGVDDPHNKRDDLSAAMAIVPTGAPTILLAHSPDIITRRLDPRIRLILCGHTHGGQICLPGGKALYNNTTLPARFSSGLHELDTVVLYVSRGIGSTRFPLRYSCLPEVTLITLTREAASG